MSKKPKTFSGRFNPEEVEAIEKTCAELGIKPNQMIKEAVALWMNIRPPITILKRTHLDELLRPMVLASIVEHKQLDPIIQKFQKKYGEPDFDTINAKLKEADKNFHALLKKKEPGRPKTKKKRGRPKR